MPKADKQLDALVLGDHPATYLTALLTASNARMRVAHTTIPGDAEPDRLVLINPDFFELAPPLASLRRKLECRSIYGLQFLADDGQTRSEFRGKAALAYVASAKAVRQAVTLAVADEGVELLTPRTLEIHSVDERGINLTLGKEPVHAKALILGGRLPPHQAKMLGLPDGWGDGVVYRYTFTRVPAARFSDLGARPVAPMSLNLRDTLYWGWMLPGPKHVQVAVSQPLESISQTAPEALLGHWIDVLRRHGLVNGKDIPLEGATQIDLPLTGALAQEGLANRTVLVGPAGGFYSACAVHFCPNCWPAVFAADAIKRAVREPHLQDALQAHTQKWRTSLGRYLQGPQQNFRYLLPLVYRNQKMTTRLSEAILQGKSVVR